MMKKFFIITSLLIISIFTVNSARAVLTNTAPQKKNTDIPVQKQYIQPQPRSIPQQVPTISTEEKLNSHDDYIKYLEQTVIDVCGFTENELISPAIQVELRFNSSGLADVRIVRVARGGYSEYRTNTYNYMENKINLCESKLFMTYIKPYAEQYNSDYFSFTIKSMQWQKAEAKSEIAKIISEKFWTPDSYFSRCRVKVIVGFDNDGYKIKSYSILDSSGNDGFNQMALVALKRFQNNYGSRILWTKGVIPGDEEIILNFRGYAID